MDVVGSALKCFLMLIGWRACCGGDMYRLTKISSPGFELEADHIETIRDVLDLYICGMCKKNHGTWHDGFPSNYKELPIEDQVTALMSTDCGCEFDFEEVEDGRVKV